MDRLSSYASRESESEPPDDRQEHEKQAVAALLDKLRLSEEAKQQETEKPPATPKQTNGDHVNSETRQEISEEPKAEEPKGEEDSPRIVSNGDEVASRKQRGIPDDIKLYEIFYGQVTHLANTQRLQVQDTVALLVSLANLALYVFYTP